MLRNRMCKKLSRFLIAILAIIPILISGGQVAYADWVFSNPPNLVTLNSNHRNNVFYVGETVNFSLGIANYGTYVLKTPITYEVRDYWGNLVDSGTTPCPTPTKGSSLTSIVTQPGWYKLYLHGGAAVATYGDSVGGTMFEIFRNNSNFPQMPSPNLPGNSTVSDGDEVTRGVTGMGPQRHPVNDASQPATAIAALDPSIAQDKQYYTPYDPQRPRPLLIAFPNGVGSSNAATQAANLAGLSQLVAHYHNDVKYWEPLNEPNYTYSGADYVNKELKPFYQTVKSIDPTCKVVGPAVVTIGPYGLTWIESFLKAGGANYIDAFSFHAYNNVNGDLTLARESLDALQALLTKYGIGNIEKWQTEQGYFAACYGAYEPRLQGRWTMLQMMVYEQYGIPKEHNHLWYDRSHGFWSVPTFWENEDGPYAEGSLNPAAPLMRVWSEELYGTNFVSAYDFGATGNKQYVGSLFGGPGKQVAAFMSAGRTDGQITLQVSSGSSIHVVSAFGVAQDLPVTGGFVTLPVPELPVYVEPAPGQTLSVQPIDFGTNLALLPGTTASASGSAVSPLGSNVGNDPSKIINGVLENWYWGQGLNDHPWMSNTSSFPAWVQITLPVPLRINHVVIYAGVPWQSDGSLLDYELQYDNAGTWVTLAHPQEPTNVVDFFTPVVFCTADSFYSDRSIFEHDFAPVTTQKIRLLVHDTTWGGGANSDIVTAGGQTGPHQITLREIELYGPDGVTVPPPSGEVRFFPRVTCAARMVGGIFQGSQDGVSYTNLFTITSTPTDGQWTEAPTLADPKNYRYLRYLSPSGSYGNVAEIEFYTGTGASAVKLAGTPFGTPGSYQNSGNTFSKVFDGNTATYFDAPTANGNFVGIDQGSAGVTAPTVTSVSVSPSTATVGGGLSQQFSVVVSGTGSPAQTVTWTASAGSINSTGLFTAPSAALSAQTITVTATSTVDTTQSGSATVTVPVTSPIVSGVSVSPSTATVIGGLTKQFSAVVSGTGSPAQTVTWTASAGSISSTGLFTAPAAAASPQTITVTATSTVDTTQSGSAIMTVPVTSPVVSGVSVSPSTATVIGGLTKQFSAVVSGTGSPAQTVTWTASAGSINSTGLFTAPAAAVSAQTISITAISAIDSTKSGSATVTIPAAVIGGSGAISYFPRAGCANRMRGGKFQGSADGITYTDLYTIPATPVDGQWTTVTLTTDPKSYRFLRYLSPSSSYGNVAEIQFFSGTGASLVKLTGTPFGSPGSYQNSGNTFIKAFDGDTSTYFDAPTAAGNFVGIDQGAN